MRYLRGIPAPKYLRFRIRGTKFQRFVQFEQPEAPCVVALLFCYVGISYARTSDFR